MTDARNFLINTDYPMDKIIYMASGSFSLGANGAGYTANVAHGLSFTPLLIGTWSTSSSFTVSHECFWSGWEGVDINSIIMSISSDGTNTKLFAINGSNSAATTIYWRVYGFMPSNINLDVSYTASLSSNFQLNSDYNYTKLIPELTGIATAAATTTITHNLGYRPQVIIWIKDGMELEQRNISGYAKVTTTTVVITAPSNDVHYRIYADGQL